MALSNFGSLLFKKMLVVRSILSTRPVDVFAFVDEILQPLFGYCYSSYQRALSRALVIQNAVKSLFVPL